jgi:hypothetical protein
MTYEHHPTTQSARVVFVIAMHPTYSYLHHPMNDNGNVTVLALPMEMGLPNTFPTVRPLHAIVHLQYQGKSKLCVHNKA